MNFFGHAAIASLTTPAVAPGVVLGAMLPDFAGMIGGRIVAVEDAAIAEGVELHHATDAVFHRLPAVAALMREVGARLNERGCSRGAARATAHVGVELLLDGVWAEDAGYARAYLAGIAVSGAGVRWEAEESGARLAGLLERLRGYGVPADLRDAGVVTRRIARAIGHRPRLRPVGDDLHVIEGVLRDSVGRVEVAAETVMRGVRAGLGLTPA